jgi:hypothetical protein
MQPRFALPAVIALLAALPSTAQTQPPASIVVEATNSIRGIGGYERKCLLVRLTSDGKVQWETTQWQKPNELHSTKIAAELVSAMTQRLDEIDPEAIQPKMGPYNVYVDTSVELLVSITTSKWKRQFSVSNPWPGRRPIKPLPKELKTVICEVSRLQAQVAEEPVEPLCAEVPAAAGPQKSQR